LSIRPDPRYENNPADFAEFKTIENGLRNFVPRIELANDKLAWQCEQAIRDYDPRISGVTHFLKLKIARE